MSSEPGTWRFKAITPNCLTGLGAAYSTDGGCNWTWIDREDHLAPDLIYALARYIEEIEER